MHRRPLLLIALVATLLLPLVASAQPTTDYLFYQTSERAFDDTIKVRFVNAIAGFPVIRIQIGDDVLVPTLAARERTDYLEVLPAPGTFRLQVFGSIGEFEPKLLDQEYTSASGVAATALLTGNAGGATAAFTIDGPLALPPGLAWIDLVNGVPGEGAYDVVDLGTGTTLLSTEGFGESLSQGIAAGSYDLEIREHGSEVALLTVRGLELPEGQRQTLAIVSPLLDQTSPATIHLLSDRFRVTAEWRDFVGLTGQGKKLSSTDESGELWFFRPSNIELVTKVIDGTGTNNAYWVYLAALSNVQFTLDVFDTQDRVGRQYFNPEGTFASFGDIEAFPQAAPE